MLLREAFKIAAKCRVKRGFMTICRVLSRVQMSCANIGDSLICNEHHFQRKKILAVMSTSGRIQGELHRLLYIISHRQAQDYVIKLEDEPSNNCSFGFLVSSQ